MNRLLIACLAAALAQFTLGCAEERTEIYEPAPAQSDTGNKIDPYRVSDDTQLAFPVPTNVDQPLDIDVAKVTNDHRDLLNPQIKYGAVPPAFDMAENLPLPNVDGVVIPTQDLDHNQVVSQPALGVQPYLTFDPPPTRGNASAIINPF